MRNKKLTLPGAVLLGAGLLFAQDAPLPSGSISINLSKESPFLLKSYTSDQSRISARGAAMVIDLRLSALLVNTSQKRIRGLALRVVSQESVGGGKGSVTYPSVNIGPGETFPARIEMQLVRPTQIANGPLVQVDDDGVLFDDLSFAGPDKLHSKRLLTAHEIEAQRDRAYFKRVLAKGKDALQNEMLASISRQSQAASLSVRVARAPAVTSAALPSEHPAKFAFVQFPDAPVELLSGDAQVAGNEARSPNIEIRNKSDKAVKYVELGWVLSDQSGRQSAASLPSPDADPLGPGKHGHLLQDTALRLYANDGRAVNIHEMRGYLRQVEFADGKIWVPSRESLEHPELRKAVAPSDEELRLANIYSKKGLEGLIEELKKF
jgi:hypothetical protein